MPSIKRFCRICGKSFDVKFCWRDRVFCCSNTCAGVYRRKPAITNTCQYCGTEFVALKSHRHKQPFCSRKCRVASQRKTQKCPTCGDSFSLPKSLISSSRGKYCSNGCRILGWKQKRLEAQAPGSYQKNGWEGRERKCYECGYQKHPEILVIHHKDGNRKNGKLDNLIPLCPTCHAEAHLKSGRHRLPSFRFKKLKFVG